ncbi:MAG: peptide deformylase [Saprospiraceae bacterium]|nr:peptide deformylase [Saprospiraceae bacterium]
MILPIYAYGQPVLKKVAVDITADYPELQQLITNMWETMYHAHGVGLAAPQIGLAIRLFVVDSVPMMEDGREAEGIKRVFINAHKVEETGTPWSYEEGCLSIPDVRGDVDRPPVLRLRFLDENFVEHEEVFTGLNARVIQHEYDHIDGVLFVERLKPLKKRLVQRRLESIRKGYADVDYRMKFYSVR